jgi:hypothetical protein
VLGVDVGSEGVASRDGRYRYVTLPAASGTTVAMVETAGGRVAAYRPVAGALTIPAVAYDGSADGLSGDGSTLALIEPRRTFPRARTRFVVFNTARLRPRAVVRLKGDFSFDAISPDGRYLHLIRYRSPADPLDYEVRVYDVTARRLLANPIVDPTEPQEQMGGTPVTRAWSPDRRWAYTLYERPGREAFIHALDTAGIAARCIDLEMLRFGEDLTRVQLLVSADGATMTLRRGADAIARVDTTTFAVTRPAAPPAQSQAGGRSGFSRPVALVGSLGALAMALCAWLVVRRRTLGAGMSAR